MDEDINNALKNVAMAVESLLEMTNFEWCTGESAEPDIKPVIELLEKTIDILSKPK